MTKLLDSDSRTHTKAGRNAEALRLAESILLASRTDALDSFLMHGISLMYRARGISTWMHAVEGCAEIDLLKKAIARMQELEAIFDNVPADSHPSDLNNVSSLRAVARHGIQVEFQGLTGRELADAALLAQARYLEERVLPDIQVDSPLRAEVLENFERMKTGWPQTTWASFGGRPTLAEITARAVSPDVFDYSLELNSRQEFFSRQQKVKIHFDLLRLETAAKLFHLERGREPDLLSELIPNYLPELPVDPWAPDGAPYRRAAEGDYYSLGPDGVDDGGGKTPFSSRSGTMSGVDVYIPPQ
jgi:hypothetical protein